MEVNLISDKLRSQQQFDSKDFIKYPYFNIELFFIIFMFPGNRKTPETLRFRGILRLDTMYLAVLNIYN